MPFSLPTHPLRGTAHAVPLTSVVLPLALLVVAGGCVWWHHTVLALLLAVTGGGLAGALWARLGIATAANRLLADMQSDGNSRRDPWPGRAECGQPQAQGAGSLGVASGLSPPPRSTAPELQALSEGLDRLLTRQQA